MTRVFTYDIPNSELEGVEDQMLKVLGMSRDKVLEKFEDDFEDTRDVAFERLECRGMIKYLRVDTIDDETIELEDGQKLNSAYLAERLAYADEVALYIVSVFGFNDLMKEAQDSMFESLFYNAWATGLSMSCHGWIKKQIANDASEHGKYPGRAWIPGEGELNLGLFKNFIEIIDPSSIGVKVLETGMVSPSMSLCAIMGVSDNPAIVEVGRNEIQIH